MKHTFLHSLLVAIGVSLGIIATILVRNHSVISLDPTITLGELVNSLATVFAALAVTVLVTFYLERHNQASRKEKDLLLDQMDYLLQLVEQFEQCYETGEYIKITASHKRLSTSNSSFYTLLKEFKYPQNILAITSFDGLMQEIRKLATDTPIRAIEKHVKLSKCSAAVKNGIIVLTAERERMLEVKISELKTKIFKAKLVINRN